jgi:hypothetical protein
MTGWIGGWLGGFIWVPILSIVLLAKGHALMGVIGLVLVVVAVVSIVLFSPWRHPETRYWKLLVPIYAVFFVSIAWALLSAGSLGDPGLGWWSLFLVLSLLSPFATIGRKRWCDGEPDPP